MKEPSLKDLNGAEKVWFIYAGHQSLGLFVFYTVQLVQANTPIKCRTSGSIYMFTFINIVHRLVAAVVRRLPPAWTPWSSRSHHHGFFRIIWGEKSKTSTALYTIRFLLCSIKKKGADRTIVLIRKRKTSQIPLRTEESVHTKALREENEGRGGNLEGGQGRVVIVLGEFVSSACCRARGE